MKSNIIILAAMMAMSCACTNEVEELSTKQEDSSLKIATYIANSEGTRSSDGFVSKTQFKTMMRSVCSCTKEHGGLLMLVFQHKITNLHSRVQAGNRQRLIT